VNVGHNRQPTVPEQIGWMWYIWFLLVMVEIVVDPFSLEANPLFVRPSFVDGRFDPLQPAQALY